MLLNSGIFVPSLLKIPTIRKCQTQPHYLDSMVSPTNSGLSPRMSRQARGRLAETSLPAAAFAARRRQCPSGGRRHADTQRSSSGATAPGWPRLGAQSWQRWRPRRKAGPGGRGQRTERWLAAPRSARKWRAVPYPSRRLPRQPGLAGRFSYRDYRPEYTSRASVPAGCYCRCTANHPFECRN